MLKGFTDPDGTLLVTEDPIDATFSFNGGLAYAPSGALAVSDADAPASFPNGIGVALTGEVCIEPLGPIVGYKDGLPVNAAGALCVDPGAGANNSFVGGVAVGPTGVRIRSVSPAPPPPPRGFSNGFDSGFGV